MKIWSKVAFVLVALETAAIVVIAVIARKKVTEYQKKMEDRMEEELFQPGIQEILETMKQTETDPIVIAALAVLTTMDDEKVAYLPELEAIEEIDPNLEKLVIKIGEIRKGLGLSDYND